MYPDSSMNNIRIDKRERGKTSMYYDKTTVSYQMTKEEKKLHNDHVRKTREDNLKVMSVKRETHREYCIRTGITQYDL